MRDAQNKLMNPSYLQGLLQRANTKPLRAAGQNFLVCPEVIEATLLAMEDGPNSVTELGSGIGTLTSALLSAGFKVRAIERDKILSEILVREVDKKSKDMLDLVVKDLRKVKWEWPEEKNKHRPYQLVGNVPYNLSGLIIRRIVQLDPAPDRVLLLLQKEVGDRLVARPPNMNLLSVAVGLWGRADILLRIPASCFWPMPKVESCLVMLSPLNIEKSDVEEREKIIATARVFFQAKRKQMAGVLRKTHEIKDQSDAILLLKKANIDGSNRPQEVTLEQWRALSHVL